MIASPAAASTQVTGLTVQGTYVFRLTAVDRAAVTNQDLSVVVRTVPGDMDADGDVDQEDFGQFQVCLSGPELPQTSPNCSKAKLDGDADVDMGDVERFLVCLSGSGPSKTADPNCAN